MSDAGLTNVTVHRVAQELKAESFDKFWNAMERTNAPLVLIKHRVGPERWQTLGPKIRERVGATLGDGPAHDRPRRLRRRRHRLTGRAALRRRAVTASECAAAC